MKVVWKFVLALGMVLGLGLSAGAQSVDPSTLKPVNLTWYMPQTVQKDQDAVFAEFNKILKEKLNTTVDIKFVDWGSYDSKIKLLTAANEKMDLIFTANWTNDYYSAVNRGAYQAISMDSINKYGPNIIKEVPAKLWPAVKVKGQLYAIPNIQVEARWPAFVVQTKYLDKYKFDLSKVKTVDDLTPLLENIAKNEPGIVTVDLSANTQLLTYFITKLGLETLSDENPNGFYLNDKSFKVTNIFETKEMLGFVKTIRTWYQKGIIQKDAATLKDNLAAKAAGKVASMFSVNNPDMLVNQSRSMGLKPEDLQVVALSDPFMYTGSIINTMTAISRTSKEPERCLMVLNAMFDTKDTRLINLLSYGIEGTHYKKVGSDLIEPIANSGYIVDCGWEYGCIFNNFRTNPGQPAWRPAGPDINNKALVSGLMGFSYDPTPVKTEMASVNSVLKQYLPGLLTGLYDIEKTLPEFQAKLKKAGNDKIIAEMQKQVDAWKAGK